MVIGRYLLRISTYFKKSNVYSAGLKLLAPCLLCTSFMKLSFPSSIKGTDRKPPPTLVIFYLNSIRYWIYGCTHVFLTQNDALKCPFSSSRKSTTFLYGGNYFANFYWTMVAFIYEQFYWKEQHQRCPGWAVVSQLPVCVYDAV